MSRTANAPTSRFMRELARTIDRIDQLERDAPINIAPVFAAATQNLQSAALIVALTPNGPA